MTKRVIPYNPVENKDPDVTFGYRKKEKNRGELGDFSEVLSRNEWMKFPM